MRDSRRFGPGLIVTLLLIAVLTLSLAPSFQATPWPAATQARRRILVISLDGLDARYLQKRDEFKLKIPTLRHLMSEGVMAPVVGIYPSVTYPSHTTIVTGANPARHGIYGNEIWEPPGTTQTGSWHWFARDIRVDTLWNMARRNQLSTALISWPVSIGAGDYNFPEIWKPNGSREETAAVIKENAHPRELIEELERKDPQLYSQQNKDEGDDMRTRFAEYVIEEKKPQVMLVHLFDLDHFEHEKGPFTPEAFAILEKVDGYVARILDAAKRAGTLDETAVFIVSDHGFMAVTKRIHPGVILARAGLAKVSTESEGKASVSVSDVRIIPYASGGSCALILRDPKDTEAYRKALAAFNDFVKSAGRGSLRIVDAGALRRLGSNPDAAFAIEAAEGYYFGNNYTGDAITPAAVRGQHGYMPNRYYASFIASGAGVTRRGQLGAIRMIDEGPTMASILGLKLRDAEGHALALK